MTVKQSINLRWIALSDTMSARTPDKALQILHQVFGEERVDIVLPSLSDIEADIKKSIPLDRESTSDTDRYVNHYCRAEVIIHFPNITIKNSSGQKKLLKDMYVKLTLDEQLRVGGHIAGLRATLSPQEERCGYRHSHLHNGQTGWDYFCTGSGPIVRLLGDLGKKFDPVAFKMLCYSIITFLEYESMETSPYDYIKNIPVSSAVSPALPELSKEEVDQAASRLERLVRALPKSELKALFGYAVEANRVQLYATESTEIRLGELLNDAPRWLAVKERGRSGGYRGISVSLAEEAQKTRKVKRLFNFKGQEVHLTIRNFYGEEIESTNNKINYYVNPQITQELLHRLSNRLTKAAINYKAPAPQNTGEGNRTPARSNNIPVSKNF